jgi:hypothetical protein
MTANDNSDYARCNLDGKPLHPGDRAIVDAFKHYLENRLDDGPLGVCGVCETPHSECSRQDWASCGNSVGEGKNNA